MPIRTEPVPPDLPAPRQVRTSSDALRVVLLALSTPLRSETLAFVLDPDGLGGAITVVSGTDDPDAVLTVAELHSMAAARLARPMSLVIASVRPDVDRRAGIGPDDMDRWWTLKAIARRHGVLLREWFVVTARGVHCPRELCDEPDGWDQPESW